MNEEVDWSAIDRTRLGIIYYKLWFLNFLSILPKPLRHFQMRKKSMIIENVQTFFKRIFRKLNYDPALFQFTFFTNIFSSVRYY